MERANLEELADRVADLILGARGVVVFTGAGVSTESGIPDFRGPGGLWTKYDPDEFTYQKFLADPEARRKSWRMLMENFLLDARPNPAHYAIAELERLGKLDCVITQNVDNLHQEAGNSPDRVFELHGNVRWVSCLSCGKRYPMAEISHRLEAGIEVPDCDDCHGILKVEGVFFGEALPQRTLEEATRRSQNCDLFIVIGSTLVVYPAAFMPSYALGAGARVVIINLSPTPLDRQAHVVIRARAGEAMSRVVEQVRDKMGRV